MQARPTRLTDGTSVDVHQIVLATGYQPDMENGTFLDRERAAGDPHRRRLSPARHGVPDIIESNI